MIKNMRFLLLFLIAAHAWATDTCDSWLINTQAKPGTSSCETICATADIDMRTFSCPSRCELFCRKKTDKTILGDSENKVLSLWGQNFERSAESYASTQLELLNYSRPNGSPEVFFSIDPVTKKVIGKSQWVYSNKQIVQFERDLKNRFPSVL
jgi:hypothetical protein